MIRNRTESSSHGNKPRIQDLLSFLLILSILLALLSSVSSCSPASQTPGESLETVDSSLPSESTGGEGENLSELQIVREGQTAFSVVRPDMASDAEVALAVSVRKAILDATGVELQIRNDFLPRGEMHDPDESAILIGATNYSESETAGKGLTYGEFRVEIVGNKLAVQFFSEAGANAAGKYLASLILQNGSEAGGLTVTSEWNCRQAFDNMLSNLTVYTDGIFKDIYDGGDNAQMVLIRQTSQEAYRAYIGEMQGIGYEIYAENTLGKNLYTTMTNERYIANLAYIAQENAARLIIEPKTKTGLPPRAEDNVYTATSVSSVTQVGLEYSYDGRPIDNFQIGMQYIVKLADSSFIVVDGGFNFQKCADMLYAQLAKLADDPNHIVIAAWFITHLHGDHYGGFRYMAQYASKIQIERVIYNCPNEQHLTSVNGGNPSSARSTIASAIAKFPGAQVVKAHPGQQFHLRNAVVDMYGTLDLLEPFKVENLNNTCLVFKVNIEGQSILFTGDSYNEETAMLVRNYGDALRADFVQVIHHGAPGGSVEFYRHVDPVIVLWPLGELDYYPNGSTYTRSKETWNAWFYSAESRVKEIHLSGSSIVTIPLPYDQVPKTN